MKNTLQHRSWISRMRRAAASAALALAAVLVSAVITAQSAQAQLTTVASFNGTNGSDPIAPLIQATNGSLYGTTNQNYGSGNGFGTAFDVTTGGTLTSLYSFCSPGDPQCADGGGLYAGLIQATNGNFYGTASAGGDYGEVGYGGGTIFQLTPGGNLTILHSFCSEINGGGFCADGDIPTAGLVQASNGYLYGTTSFGGEYGGGTVFKITTNGKLTTLYNFCSAPSCGNDKPGPADGFYPVVGLIQATNGDMYGTTAAGGANRGVQINGGTVFQITPAGAFTVLYSFCAQINCTDGLSPNAPLVQAANGNLYGSTVLDGANGYGTIFEITTKGVLTTLYSFCSQPDCADGSIGGGNFTPEPALIQGTDGNLYGVTPYGGNTTSGVNSNGYGTIFEMTLSGALTTIYTFCTVSGCSDSGNPWAGLIQDTNGNFYGTTSGGEAGGYGTVFSLSTGLGPFVTTQPAFAAVGEAVTILGTDLTTATGVTFNGIPAAFTVVSSSEITTSVPTGATAGYVTVTTPSGTLTSNVPFRLSTALIATTTALTSSPNPSTSGEPVTFTALVSFGAGAPPNGETISFMKGATVLGTGTLSGGSASFTTSTLSVGTTSVKAVYAGDAYFKGSKSNVVKQVVDKAAN